MLLAIRAALPLGLAWGIGEAVERASGLRAQVDDVDLWLMRGAIAVEGLRVARQPGPETSLDGEATLFQGERIHANLAWTALLDGRIHLQELSLDAPHVRLQRAPAGGIDTSFLDGLPAEPPAPEATPAPASSGPPPLRLDGLSVRRVTLEVLDPETGTKPALVRLAELSLSHLALEDGELSLGAFSIREPSIDLSREFAQGFGGGADSEAVASAPAAPESDPLRYRADRLELAGGDLVLRVGERSLRVAVALAAEGASLRGGPFQTSLRVRIEDGSVELDGSLGLVPLSFQGSLRWQGIPVPLTVLAARPDLVSWIRSCRTRGELEIELRSEPTGEPGELRLQGNAAIEDLELASPGDTEEILVAFELLSVGLRELALPLASAEDRPPRIELGSVRLVAPRLLYTTPAPSLETLAAGNGQAEPAPEPGDAGPEPELHIESVEIVDGDVRFVDRNVGYRGRLRDLDVEVEGVRLPGPTVARARLASRPVHAKSLSLGGALEPPSGSLQLDFQQLALPPLNAYAEPAGYRLSRGHASLSTAVRMEGDALEATNRVELSDLGVEAQDPEAFRAMFGLPLDLVLALLRDASGRIALDVPVRMALAEGTTGIGVTSILQSALRQALVGATTSPLKMGGFALSALGVGGPAAEPLASAPGGVAWLEGEDDRIAASAALLAARPQLGLSLRGQSGPADEPTTAEAVLVETLGAGGDLPDLDGVGRLERRRIAGALRARARGEPGALGEEDTALLARYVASVEVPPARLEALAQRRAEAARDALVEAGVDVARLSLEPPGAGEPGVLLELAVVD